MPESRKCIRRPGIEPHLYLFALAVDHRATTTNHDAPRIQIGVHRGFNLQVAPANATFVSLITCAVKFHMREGT